MFSPNPSAHSHLQEIHHLHPPPPPQTSDHPYHHQLLFYCAQLISQSDFAAARRLISFLSSHSSPSGDSSNRLLHYFITALSLRLHHHHPPPFHHHYHNPNNTTLFQSSYLSLNQITPFIRFSHLTANQSILETINQQPHSQYIHILDFNIMHGIQWPSFMHSISNHHPPPTLRLTSTGTNLETLRKTGSRLSDFAHSLGLNFRFHPLLLTKEDNVNDLVYHLSSVVLRSNEIFVVNCVCYLHRMLRKREDLCLLVRKIRSMNPKVVTLVEREANHNHPLFMSRFGEALKYYTAVFDSLEATLPPNSRERMEVEQMWFGREIVDIVAVEEGEKRKERHERFQSWEEMMRNIGFRIIPLSTFAVAQAKLLLRLHYPSEGYDLEVFNDCFNLGWQNQPLFSVSSWH